MEKSINKLSIYNGKEMMYRGEKYYLQIFKLGKRDNVYINGSFIIICSPNADNEEELKKLLEKFYREQARKIFTKKALYFAEKMNVSFERIAIKEQKTRWGSCSSKGNLNFNWKVIKAPDYVIDYLVVHELSHRKQMNHSKEFWKVVEDTLPDYNAGREWLKKNTL